MENYIAFFTHHWQLSALLIVLVVAIAIYELFFIAGGAKRVIPQTAVLMINHENAIVLDIRDSAAFKTGHIINAINIPDAELKNKLKKLDKYKNKPIIIACAIDQQAARSAETLSKNEFTNVRVLAGGIKAWQDAKLPLEK